jgi:hypothetical protein
MKYFKKANKSDRFTFKYATIMTQILKNNIDFYVGDYTEFNTFYRCISLYKNELFIDTSLFGVCTKQEIPEFSFPTPGDSGLIKYHNYFTNINK